MVRLPRSLASRGTPAFAATLKEELESLDADTLPLQQGLSRGSHVGEAPFQVVLLSHSASEDRILAKVGVFFTGIIAGCSCADDPTPVEGHTEYCEIQVEIEPGGGSVRFRLTGD